MSNYSNAIGIDISRDTFDVHDFKLGIHKVYPNNESGFKQLLSQARKSYKNMFFPHIKGNPAIISFILSLFTFFNSIIN